MNFFIISKHYEKGVLHNFCEAIKETIGSTVIDVVTDKGYDCREEILLYLMDGTVPYVGFKDDKGERLYPIEYIPNQITA